MMQLYRQNRIYVILPLILAVGYFLIRLPNLTLQPIFADEAIYIRWAQIMRAEPSLRFVSLQDGKTPLFMWSMIPLFKIVADPLMAGRLLSVLAGFFTFLGVGYLGLISFGKRVGLWSLFLAVFTPFLVFFDRMALVDSMLAAFAIWALNIALLLIKKSRIDLAMLLGYLLGGAILTKTPGFFNLLVLPLTALIGDWTGQKRELKILKIFGLWLIAFVITFGMYSILKLGPGVQNLNSRDQDYVRSPLAVLLKPYDPFLPHLFDILRWLPAFFTPVILLAVLLGIVLVVKKLDRVGLAILGWSLIPMLILMMFLQTFTARYILFQIPPLLVLGAYGIDWLITLLHSKKFDYQTYSILMIILVLPLTLNFNLKLLTNPAAAPLPADERQGYLEDWTAGYGFPEIARYLEDQAKSQLVVVGTEGFFGTLPDGLQIYLDKDRQVIVQGSRATVSAELRTAAKDHPTFFVANKSRFQTPQRDMILIKEYPKAQGSSIPPDSILFYQVFP